MEKHHKNLIILRVYLGIFIGKEILGEMTTNTNFITFIWVLAQRKKINQELYLWFNIFFWEFCSTWPWNISQEGIVYFHECWQHINDAPPSRDNKNRPLSKILERLGDGGLKSSWQKWKVSAGYEIISRLRRNADLLLITWKKVYWNYTGFWKFMSSLPAEKILRALL